MTYLLAVGGRVDGERRVECHPVEAVPRCPVCVDERTDLLFWKNDYNVFRCARCGLEFLYPQPADDVLASIYGAQYFLGSEDAESSERRARLKTATALRYLRLVVERLPAGQQRMFEIGCGTGDLLLQAQAAGFHVRGIEFSRSSAAVANRRLGSDLVGVGTIETAPPSPQQFDLVVACDVIEHVRDPKSFLAHVYACLKPGGLVFLVTPSCDSWSRKLLRRSWMEYKTEHLFYFGRTSMTRLMTEAGFESVRFSPNRKVLSIDYLDLHFRRFPVPICTQILKGIRRLLPHALAHKHFTIPASGLMVTARKPRTAVPQT